MTRQHQQYQQQRGILPAHILNALDILVDRLNASSGYFPFYGSSNSTTTTDSTTTTTRTTPGAGGGSAAAAAAAAVSVTTTDSKSSLLPQMNEIVVRANDATTDNTNSSLLLPRETTTTTTTTTTTPTYTSPPIKALLVGTNEGVGLSRSLGTFFYSESTSSRRGNNNNGSSTTGSSTTTPPPSSVTIDGHDNNNNSMSEEILSTIETVWATLPSAVAPHIMASVPTTSTPLDNDDDDDDDDDDSRSSRNYIHHQPPHPLLSPLQLGSIVKTTTATYSNCIVMHIHYPPLVVTLLMSPNVNLGAVRNVLFGNANVDRTTTTTTTMMKNKNLLEVLLEPVRRALIRSRCEYGIGGGAVAPGMGGMVGNVPSSHNDDDMMLLMMSRQAQQ